MNSKLLYAATIAVSLVSTFAMADEAPLTRAQVNAEARAAVANGSIPRNDYDVPNQANLSTRSTTTRAQVAVDFAQNRAARRVLVGADASPDYNPFGTHIFDTSTLARSEVKAETLQAAREGTLQRTDYDDAASLNRQARAHIAGETLAQRLKARFKHDAT